MLCILCVAALGTLLVSGTGASDLARKPLLRFVSKQPLAVQGQSFASGERVRVRVEASLTAARRVRASRAGAFTARFEDIVVTRCDTVRIVAVGSRGSRAVLKYLPAPACLPS
jgi:hypothetical protein